MNFVEVHAASSHRVQSEEAARDIPPSWAHRVDHSAGLRRCERHRGIGLVGGGIQFPLGWLHGSPFSGYTFPELIFGLVVGGDQLLALVGVLRHKDWAVLALGAADCIMMGWIIGEVLIDGSERGVMRTLQLLYFANGLLEAGLAAFQLRAA